MACGERPDDERGRARAYLQRFLQDNAVSLQGIICGYVSKMGLATGEHIEAVAAEIFQDAVIETLAHAERFHPDMQPRPWFLAIAANILKRHRASYAKRSRFEVLIGHVASISGRESEQDVLDLLIPATAPGPEQMLERREAVQELLALVSPADAQLLSMALLEGWNTTALPASLAKQAANLPGLSVISSEDVWVAGSIHSNDQVNHLLILHWNGKTWQQVSPPPLQESYNLPNGSASGIASYGERQVWIVGNQQDSDGGYSSALILGQLTCPQ